MNKAEFTQLLHGLAKAWTHSDYSKVCQAFAPNVHYTDPTRYSFHGLEELRSFFNDNQGADEFCEMHTVIFDEEKQLGAAEYTYEGTHRYHGLVLIRMVNDKIVSWREYQHTDAREWDVFIKGPSKT